VARVVLERVKNGAWAPLRFMSMPSRPATGIARAEVTMGLLALTERLLVNLR